MLSIDLIVCPCCRPIARRWTAGLIVLLLASIFLSRAVADDKQGASPTRENDQGGIAGVYAGTCLADIASLGDPELCGDGDRVVGPGDLAELLANWGPCAGCCADIFPSPGPDGIVGPGDLAQLLANWGPCPSCGHAGAGNCYESTPFPGCVDIGCCDTVCGLDPFCCSVSWDELCVGSAVVECGGCGNPLAGSCFQPQNTPGCTDVECCAIVCAVDTYCCNVAWDGICSSGARELCGGCGNPDAGSCLIPHEGTGCSNLDCCDIVCLADPYCCAVGWDEFCVGEAGDYCEISDCCYVNDAGCAGPACESCVCGIDPFCCTTSWDQQCAGEAANQCDASCPCG